MYIWIICIAFLSYSHIVMSWNVKFQDLSHVIMSFPVRGSLLRRAAETLFSMAQRVRSSAVILEQNPSPTISWKHLSRVLNVLHGGTKQGKAYAAAYALLTRAQVLLTHVIVPYADLTRTIISTSPQFRLTRSNFYMQESKQWLAKSSSGRWRRGRRGRRWWRSTTSRSSQSTKLPTFFDSTLAESTGMTGEFLFQGSFGQRHAGTLVCLLAWKLPGMFSHISGLRADGFPCTRLVIISTAPNFSIHRRCKLRNCPRTQRFFVRNIAEDIVLYGNPWWNIPAWLGGQAVCPSDFEARALKMSLCHSPLQGSQY